MPLLDYSDPHVIRLVVNSIERESVLRSQWFNKNREKIEKAVVLNREFTNYYKTDVLKEEMRVVMPAITREHINAGYNRKKKPIRDGIFIPGVAHLVRGHSIPEVGLGDSKNDPKLGRPDTDLRPDPIIRPVDPVVRKQLYKIKPTAKPNRELYLEKRVKIMPENRYYFAECTNWDYGWRMKDSEVRQNRSYGRCGHLSRMMNNRVGPQPDPPHYKTPDIAGATKCKFA